MHNFKLYILITTISLLASSAFAQPDTLWSARVNAAGNPTIYYAIEHSSGDYIVVGETNPGIANSNTLISRLSSNGAVQWTRTFGGSNSDAAQSCVEMTDGNLVVVGFGNGGNMLLLMAVSASGDSLWSRTYGSGGMTCAYHAVSLHDGNLAVVGYRMGADHLHSDLWLLKCNSSGDTIWTRSFGGSDTDIGCRITERQDRTLSIAGYTKSSGAGDYNQWLLRTDSLGSLLSASLYGGIAPDFCYDFSDGNDAVYLGGKTTVAGSNLGYLTKASSNGDSLWSRSCTHGGVEEQLRGVVARGSGGVICAGWTGPSWNNRRSWLLAISAGGTDVWQWILDSVGSGFYGIIPVSSGGYLTYGQVTEINVRRGYVLRLSVSGVRGAVVETGSGAPVIGARIGVAGHSQYTITDQHGEFQLGLISGTYDLTVSGNCISRDTTMTVVVPRDSLVVADFQVNRPRYVQNQSSVNVYVYNHVLTSVPIQIFNTGSGAMEFGIHPQSIYPAGNWLTVAPDTGLLQPGDTLTVQVEIIADTTNNGGFDFQGSLLVTTNSCPGDSATIPVMVFVLDAEPNEAAIPGSFSLSAYPNPFNPATTISISVPRLARTTLAVYDITGRCVAVLADNVFSPGTHRLPFNAGQLSSGLYLVRMESESFHSTRKIMLIK